VIGDLSSENFGFVQDLHLKDTDMYVGGFDWDLIHQWHRIPDREIKRRKQRTDPIQSPAMIGIYLVSIFLYIFEFEEFIFFFQVVYLLSIENILSF
jgi:hypothetical protein